MKIVKNVIEKMKNQRSVGKCEMTVLSYYAERLSIMDGILLVEFVYTIWVRHTLQLMPFANILCPVGNKIF